MSGGCAFQSLESMADVKLKNIKKVYDKNVVAVQEFSLDIADKEFIVLVGPSGCGKSTTLRMVAGLEEITSGELYIDDKLMNDVAPKDRDIAMVFQNYALYPHMTVFENMAFALKLRKVPKAEIEQKVQEAAEILGIEELLKRKPKQLSGGQRQRVAIGRAIVRNPQVFLMDEPLSNLDAKLRNQMRAELIKLRQRIDTTFIYVTHDQIEAMTLGDRIVIMKDGFIQQIGTPQDVFNEPNNKFVAGFIGTPQMNFFHAELLEQGGDYVVKMHGATIQLPQERRKQLAQNGRRSGPCTMGIRPEHMQIIPQSAPEAFKAKVDVTELMGSEVYIHMDLGEDRLVSRVPTADIDHQQLLQPGAQPEVFLVASPRHVHLFDVETEQSMFLA